MARLLAMWMVAGVVWAQAPVKFMGRVVTVINPGFEDEAHLFPKGAASVCLDGTPRRCYTGPAGYGNAEASIIELNRATSAIFFMATSGGVSGFGLHFALLRPGTGKELENLLPSQLSVSNQSEHAWWTDLSISDSKIFITANYAWGPDDSHYGPHRYLVSSYVCRAGEMLSYGCHLDDQYMTARAYDGESQKILESEKPEIIARLKRVRQKAGERK